MQSPLPMVNRYISILNDGGALLLIHSSSASPSRSVSLFLLFGYDTIVIVLLRFNCGRKKRIGENLCKNASDSLLCLLEYLRDVVY